MLLPLREGDRGTGAGRIRAGRTRGGKGGRNAVLVKREAEMGEGSGRGATARGWEIGKGQSVFVFCVIVELVIFGVCFGFL